MGMKTKYKLLLSIPELLQRNQTGTDWHINITTLRRLVLLGTMVITFYQKFVLNFGGIPSKFLK